MRNISEWLWGFWPGKPGFWLLATFAALATLLFLTASP